MGNPEEKTPVFQKIHVQVGDTPKHTISYSRSTRYIIVWAELPDTTDRHYIQHLRGELAKDPPNSFPVWGSLSWVDNTNPQRAHIAILGAQIPGTRYTGCVYDTVEKQWVSKVCLGVNDQSFNFDTIFLSALRFESFILPFLTEGASDEVQFHEKLPIVSIIVQTGA